MRDRNIELMRKVCEEMGVEWDNEAKGIEVNGKLMDKTMLDDLFLSDNPYIVFGRCNDKPEPTVSNEWREKNMPRIKSMISNIDDILNKIELTRRGIADERNATK